MSTEDFQGAAHAFRVFMRSAQADIDTEVRKGADRRFPRPDDRKTRMSWREQLLARCERVRRSA